MPILLCIVPMLSSHPLTQSKARMDPLIAAHHLEKSNMTICNKKRKGNDVAMHGVNDCKYIFESVVECSVLVKHDNSNDKDANSNKATDKREERTAVLSDSSLTSSNDCSSLISLLVCARDGKLSTSSRSILDTFKISNKNKDQENMFLTVQSLSARTIMAKITLVPPQQFCAS